MHAGSTKSGRCVPDRVVVTLAKLVGTGRKDSFKVEVTIAARGTAGVAVVTNAAQGRVDRWRALKTVSDAGAAVTKPTRTAMTRPDAEYASIGGTIVGIGGCNLGNVARRCLEDCFLSKVLCFKKCQSADGPNMNATGTLYLTCMYQSTPNGSTGSWRTGGRSSRFVGIGIDLSEGGCPHSLDVNTIVTCR